MGGRALRGGGMDARGWRTDSLGEGLGDRGERYHRREGIRRASKEGVEKHRGPTEAESHYVRTEYIAFESI